MDGFVRLHPEDLEALADAVARRLVVRGVASERRPRGSLERRFWPKVERRGVGECWEWRAGLCTRGYGMIREAGAGSRRLMAHRVAYELVVGPIPAGLVVDHLCGNKACVNPAHLEPVTQGENVRRARRAAVC